MLDNSKTLFEIHYDKVSAQVTRIGFLFLLYLEEAVAEQFFHWEL